MTTRIDAEKRLSALAMAATGQSQRQICKRLGVSKSTVQRWLASSPPDPACAPPEPACAPPEPACAPPAPPSDAPARALLSRIVEAATERADDALASNDTVAAQRLVRDLREAANTLARVERDTRIDGLALPKSGWLDAKRSTLRKLDLFLEANKHRLPSHCPGCGVAISIRPFAADGAEGAPEQDAPPTPTPNPAAPLARDAYDRSMRISAVAGDDGNTRASARAIRDALGAAQTIARIERDEQPVDDLIAVGSDELARNAERTRANLAKLRAVPLMCPSCLRASRIKAVGAAPTARAAG